MASKIPAIGSRYAASIRGSIHRHSRRAHPEFHVERRRYINRVYGPKGLASRSGLFRCPGESSSPRWREIYAHDDLVHVWSSALAALLPECGKLGIDPCRHRSDRTICVPEAVVADGAGQQAAESDVFTGSDSQELRAI
jgi:hypothetical protein